MNDFIRSYIQRLVSIAPISIRLSREMWIIDRMFEASDFDGTPNHRIAVRSGKADPRLVRTMSPQPREVLCVHGDETATDQFSSGLYQELNVRTYAPRNLETFRFD